MKKLKIWKREANVIFIVKNSSDKCYCRFQKFHFHILFVARSFFEIQASEEQTEGAEDAQPSVPAGENEEDKVIVVRGYG